MSKPKLSDVARVAGVSDTTASLVLSGKGNISNKVRAEVIEAANRLGYKKTSLEGKQKIFRKVGILLCVEQPHSSALSLIWKIISEIEAIMKTVRYVCLSIIIYASENDQEVMEKIMISGVGAVFAINYINKNIFDKLENMDIPVITVNNIILQDQFYSVCVDEFQGAYEGTKHLISLGHRFILFAEYAHSSSPKILDRYIGFTKAIEEFNLNSYEDNCVRFDIKDPEQMENQLENILSNSKNSPTALFAYDDFLASHILNVLKKRGVNVPEDFSLIACGASLDYTLPFYPQISTMNVDFDIMGRTAAKLMMERLDKLLEFNQVLKIKPRFIDRGTTQAPPSA